MPQAAIIGGLVLAGLLTASTCAAQEKRLVAIIGEGLELCGRWAERHSGDVRAASDADPGFQDAWVLGFLSGVNWGRAAGTPDILVATDADGLVQWVTDYCRANPDDHVLFATDKLRDELAARASARH